MVVEEEKKRTAGNTDRCEGHSVHFRLQSTVRCRGPRLTGHPSKNKRQRHEAQKKKETCLWSSTATLCVSQINPHTLLPDTLEPTSVEDVVTEDQCVLAVLASDCAMLRVRLDEVMVIETGDNGAIFSVAFHSDGMQLLGGKQFGLQRWRVADGHEVGNQMGMDVNAISVSRDGKWIVCGTTEGANVWDAKTHEKSIEVEGTDYVRAVDISPESTRFATAAGAVHTASIWDIITGKRLVGPLQQDSYTNGIKFSPNGEHVATASDDSIRVFDSRNGNQLITIDVRIRRWGATTPLAWSNNGQQLFAASSDRKIKAFEVSTGSQLAELQVDGDDDEVVSIALATNGKFLATFAGHSISFWDTSMLTQIGPAIDDSQKIRSIALSPDCSCLATGGADGNITIRNLNNILPDLYGPFHVSIYSFTILLYMPRTVFPISISPLGTYSRRSRIG
jgi:WD40 repeat protein